MDKNIINFYALGMKNFACLYDTTIIFNRCQDDGCCCYSDVTPSHLSEDECLELQVMNINFVLISLCLSHITKKENELKLHTRRASACMVCRDAREDVTIKSEHEKKLSTFTLRSNTFSMSINRHKYEKHYKMKAQGVSEREKAKKSHNTWHAFLQPCYVYNIHNEA